MKHHGKSRHRFADNPLEKAFADAWEEHNEQGHTLEYMLGNGNQLAPWSVIAQGPDAPVITDRDEGPDAPVITDRDVMVAATVVQWLGSHVGQCFLAEVLSTDAAAEVRERIRNSIDRDIRVAELVREWERYDTTPSKRR